MESLGRSHLEQKFSSLLLTAKLCWRPGRGVVQQMWPNQHAIISVASEHSKHKRQPTIEPLLTPVVISQKREQKDKGCNYRPEENGRIDWKIGQRENRTGGLKSELAINWPFKSVKSIEDGSLIWMKEHTPRTKLAIVLCGPKWQLPQFHSGSSERKCNLPVLKGKHALDLAGRQLNDKQRVPCVRWKENPSQQEPPLWGNLAALSNHYRLLASSKRSNLASQCRRYRKRRDNW